jgi:hypothetical protein
MKQLNEIAAKTVEEMKYLNKTLDEKKKNLEIELNEIKSRIMETIKAERRLDSYLSDSGICPVCFISSGSSFQIKPIASDSALDKFRCSNCGLEIEIEI